MAFIQSGWGRTSSTGNEAANIWYTYKQTADAIATIKGSGYFNSLIPDLTLGVGVLSIGDIIHAQGSDDYALLRVTAVITAVTVVEYSLAAIDAGSVVNSHVSATAAIVPSKFAVTTGNMLVGAAGVGALLDTTTDGAIVIGNGTTVTSTAVSGDIGLTNAGVASITADSIINADVKSDAGIVPSKFAVTTGSMVVGAAGIGAELDVSTDTGIMIGNGTTATVAVLSGAATMTNAGVVTLAVPKVRVSKLHTWAGGAATTDTITLTGVAATDAIHITVNTLAGAAVFVVSAVRSGADSVLITMSAAMADGDILSATAIQVV